MKVTLHWTVKNYIKITSICLCVSICDLCFVHYIYRMRLLIAGLNETCFQTCSNGDLIHISKVGNSVHQHNLPKAELWVVHELSNHWSQTHTANGCIQLEQIKTAKTLYTPMPIYAVGKHQWCMLQWNGRLMPANHSSSRGSTLVLMLDLTTVRALINVHSTWTVLSHSEDN